MCFGSEVGGGGGIVEGRRPPSLPAPSPGGSRAVRGLCVCVCIGS